MKQDLPEPKEETDKSTPTQQLMELIDTSFLKTVLIFFPREID